MKPSRVFARAVLLGVALAPVCSTVTRPVLRHPSLSSLHDRSGANFDRSTGFEPFVGSGRIHLVQSPRRTLRATSTVLFLVAPVSLPEGAAIDELCFVCQRHGPRRTRPVRIWSPPSSRRSGEDAALKSLVGIGPPTRRLGYRRYCVDLAEVLKGRIDVDEDGILDNAVLLRPCVPPALQQRARIRLSGRGPDHLEAAGQPAAVGRDVCRRAGVRIPSSHSSRRSRRPESPAAAAAESSVRTTP